MTFTSNIKGKTSTENSSSGTAPAGAGSFTGTAVNVESYGSVAVLIQTGNANGSPAVQVQFGPDGAAWPISKDFELGAGSTGNFIVPVVGKWMRVIFNNGGASDTIELQTILVVSSNQDVVDGKGQVEVQNTVNTTANLATVGGSAVSQVGGVQNVAVTSVGGTVGTNLATVGGSAVSQTAGVQDVAVTSVGGTVSTSANVTQLGGSAISHTAGVQDVAVTSVGGTVSTSANVTQIGGSAISQTAGVQDVNIAGGTISTSVDQTLIDAFGRQKVSNPQTLIDTKFLTDENPETWDTIVTGGATSVWHPGYMELQVAGAGDRVVRQSRLYAPYQPGKGLNALITGTLETTANGGLMSRIGLFDDNGDKDGVKDTDAGGNGYFFQYNSSTTTLSVVERSYITGSQVDTVVDQASWNMDTMDGAGPSGITLDVSKRQIFFIEMEWLGVGSAVMGIIVDRHLYFVHKFMHANLASELPYIPRPSLPVRYELSSTSNAGRMIQICATVLSDGGYAPLGNVFSLDMGLGAGVRTLDTTERPTMILRLKNARRRTNLNITKISALKIGAGQDVVFRIYRLISPLEANYNLIFSPVPGGWVSAGDHSAVEAAYGANIASNMTINFGNANQVLIDQLYLASFASANLNDLSSKFAIIANSNIIGDSDLIMVTASCHSGNTDISMGLQWQELE